jgi:hypothetical protein
MQNLGTHRVEKRLGAFGLPMFREQRNEVLLDRLPESIAFDVA